ncbi:MAG TPA: asparaginase [Blastocatellia bacterium]|nr:asparaginase [Blastocatellia bacterium]
MKDSENHTCSARDQTAPQTVPLVEVTRGELVEARHRGFIAVVDGHGKLIASLGDISTRTWYRSAAKPFQTIPLISSGAADHFRLTPRELAVATASHSGEAIHLEAVASILSKIGLAESALRCGAHAPFDADAAQRLSEAGEEPSALHNNCSGKHAGMLALAGFLNEPVDDYLNPTHPVQQQIRAVLAQFADVQPDEISLAVDGCSAPVFGLSIEAMARSYARLVAAEQTGLPENLRLAAGRVLSAMREYPEMIGGTQGRLDTDLMRAARGRIISKVGAEGVQLLGVLPGDDYPHGLGIAIKIEDGDTRRARDPVVIETLRQSGLLDQSQLRQLDQYAHSVIRNHRQLEVGEVRARFTLR